MDGVNGSSFVKYASFLSILVFVLAYVYRTPPEAMLDDRLDNVLSSLLRAERKVGMDDVARPRVAIGECRRPLLRVSIVFMGISSSCIGDSTERWS